MYEEEKTNTFIVSVLSGPGVACNVISYHSEYTVINISEDYIRYVNIRL